MKKSYKRMMIFFLFIVISLSGCHLQKETYTITYAIAEKDFDSSNCIPLEVGETLTQIEFSYNRSAVITSNGRLFMWGDSYFNQIYNVVGRVVTIPTDITSLFHLALEEKIHKVVFGSNHYAAITSHGRLFMWGNNWKGELGNGATTSIFRYIPIDITSHFDLTEGDEIIQVTLGSDFSAAITAEGRVFTWGSDKDGRRGFGWPTYYKLTPFDITSNFNLEAEDRITYISLGYFHSAAISLHGRVFTWGEGGSGKLGIGTDSGTRYLPVEITSNFNLDSNEKIIQVSLGYSHSLTISSNGRVFAWGSNYHNQLGNNVRLPHTTPVDVTSYLGLTDNEKVIQVSAGNSHSCAITSKARSFTWGNNWKGALGDGTDVTQGKPVDVSSAIPLLLDETVVQIDAGSNHTAVLTSFGRAFAWGRNSSGQIGDRTTDPVRLTPVEVLFDSFVIDQVVTYHLNDAIDYIPTREGYIFDGWYQDTHLTTRNILKTMPATNLTLYARWIPASSNI